MGGDGDRQRAGPTRERCGAAPDGGEDRVQPRYGSGWVGCETITGRGLALGEACATAESVMQDSSLRSGRESTWVERQLNSHQTQPSAPAGARITLDGAKGVRALRI